MKDISSGRWKLAQKFEEKCWANIQGDFVKEHSKLYKNKAKYLIDLISNKIKLNSKTKFLQIGCACADIINYLPYENKYSLDPLADFYKSKFKLDYDETHFIKGVGEKLPYSDNFFDIVILANVLDHTQDPNKVLSEIFRVLNDDGILYFENHFYQKSFLITSKIYSFLQKIFLWKTFNPCHPHMMSFKELKSILQNKFKIIFEEKIGKDIEKEINNLKELKQYCLKQKLTVRIPAFFGMFGTINFTCLCKKKL